MKLARNVMIAAAIAVLMPLAARAEPGEAPPADGPMAQAPEQPGPGMSGHGGHRGGGPGMADGKGMMEQLKLTDDQIKKIAEIRDRHERNAIKMRADLETARLDMKKLLQADEPDRKAIETQIDRSSQLRANLAKERMAGMLDMRAVLTPEQRKQWRDMHRGGSWGRHGMMRGGGHGMHGGRGPDDDGMGMMHDSDGPDEAPGSWN
jgi:Spy/CpxP family protein refolding chaperone